MKVNELMIGDLVMSAKNKTVYQIDAAIAYGITDAILRRDQDIDNRFEPIPLTPEILEKNGFEYFGDKGISCRGHEIMRDRTNEHEYSKEQFFFMNIGAFRMRIRYVHELQHALRLCGLNDLADSFLI